MIFGRGRRYGEAIRARLRAIAIRAQFLLGECPEFGISARGLRMGGQTPLFFRVWRMP